MMDVTPDSPAVDDELVDGSSVRAGELDAVDEQLIARLAGRARAGGLALASATTATTPPAGTAGTPATVTAPRPC